MADSRAFKPPRSPPHFTGELWQNPDKTLGGVLTDVFNTPIHIIAKKEGASYFIRGWRGDAPEFLRLPLIDDKPEEDGLPEAGCPRCEGKLYWRASVVPGQQPEQRRLWLCVKCDPAPDGLWLDGCAVPEKPREKSPETEGTLL